MLAVAVVGCGYWGPNLIRNFATCPTTKLVAVCDADAIRMQKALSGYPGARAANNFQELLISPDIDAIAIATPVRTHGPMALAALRAGKHVLVEKPLAASVAEAEQLVSVAREKNLTLMVDHTFIYGGPVRKMKDILDRGELGDLYFIDSVRINLGIFQHDVNVVWDLAPHDLSIVDFLLGRQPRSLAAFGSYHRDNPREIEDVAYLNLDFGDNLLASFHVNWLSPVKVRHFIIGGSKKSIVYNDLEPTEKLKVYDCGITVFENLEAQRDLRIGYRTGDVWSPQVDPSESLQVMVRHFADCIREQKRPFSDGEAGLRIVRVLEAAQRSIKAQGERITL